MISTVVGTVLGSIAGYFGTLGRPAPDAGHRSVPRRPGHRHPRHRHQEGRATAAPPSLVIAGARVDVHRPSRPQPGAVDQGEGVRRGGAGVRRVESPRSSSATCCRTRSGPIVVNTTLTVARGHPHRVDAVVPRLRRAAADDVVGPPARRRRRATSGTHKAYLIYFPGLALLLVVLAVNFLGDGLRDAFDPQAGA